MALEVGSRLGHYDVTALIGEGGMGQVYQATDTTLDREVALKVLPDAFTADPDRLARFEREAKVLASLNHPNIGAIYGLEKSGDTRALVLELVEGPTLADRIKQGPIPLDEALPIAKQIAEALEAAHEAGVIHRDLKPANIKVRDDGTVKVLDFGLAKALDPNPAGDPSQSPTLTAAATQMGMIMGTAAYMSPEQARGKTVDKRTDIWAFGCVLYEMLTGQRVFEGSDVSETLAQVIMKDIAWSALPTGTPQPISQVLRRCLERDPKRRLRDIGDATLETAGGERFDVGSVNVCFQPAFWQRPGAIAIGAALLVVVTGLAVWRLAPGTARAGDPVSVRIGGLGIHPSSEVAISPDGARIAYRGSDDQIYLRRLDQLEAVPLRGTAPGNWPFFSTDGNWIGFTPGFVSRLSKVSVFGGVPEPLVELPGQIAGMTWGADDVVIVGTRTQGLYRVSPGGDEPEELTTPNREQGELAHSWPSFLANDSALLLAVAEGEIGAPNYQLAALRFETGEINRLGLAGLMPRYVATGHIIYRGTDDSLRGVTFDAERLVITGTPVSLVDQISDFDISDTGRLIYRTGTGAARALVWVGRNGEVTSILTDEPLHSPRLSPDGSRVIYSDDSDVWLHDLELGHNVRITTEGGLRAIWTPDGTRVTYTAQRAGDFDVYTQAADGSGPAALLVDAPPEGRVPSSWTPDGRTLLLFGNHPETKNDIWVANMEGEETPFLVTDFDEAGPQVSPDGRWVAYTSDRPGEHRVFVQPFPQGGAPIAVSSGPGTEPVWSRNGDELFYRGESHLMAVPVNADGDFSVGRPVALFEDSFVRNGNRSFPYYDVSLDAQRFLMITPQEQSDALIENDDPIIVFNWFKELKRLVPAD